MLGGMKLARCLSKVKVTTWDKIKTQLYDKCPQPDDHGVFSLNTKHQEAILALGIFYLESGFRHEDRILEYLITLVRGLGTASFPDELPSDRSSKLPPAEIFSFLLITLLNDVGSHHSTWTMPAAGQAPHPVGGCELRGQGVSKGYDGSMEAPGIH